MKGKIELYPCPYCGSDNVEPIAGFSGSYVVCRDCGGTGPELGTLFFFAVADKKTLKQAIPGIELIVSTMWNARRDLPRKIEMRKPIPCRFCGGDSYVVDLRLKTGGYEARVMCSACNAASPAVRASSKTIAVKLAIHTWNNGDFPVEVGEQHDDNH